MKKDSEQKEYIIEYNMLVVNILAFGLLFLMMFVVYGLTKFKIMNIDFMEYDKLLTGFKAIVFFIILILWMVLHEIIHGVTYQIGGAKSTDIVFGASLENGVFYCKAKEYINKKCIMMSLLAPLVLIGIVTFIIGVIISNVWLIVLSIANISGAAGDIMMFMFFLKQKDDVEFRELGFSSPAVVKTSENIAEKKYFGIKNIRLVSDKKEITEGPEKKITISKGTWIFLIIMFILLLICALATNKK